MNKSFTMPVILVSAFVLSACSVGSHGDRIADSMRTQEKLSERIFDLEPFNRIAIDITATLNIRRGDEQKIRIRTQQDHFAYLDIKSRAGRLSIAHDGAHKGRRHVMIDIVTPNLDRLDTSGVVEAEIKDIKSDDFNLNHEGLGDIYLSGTCEQADFNIAGMGDLTAIDLRCAHVTIDMAGLGDAEIYATESVRVSGAGFGDIDIYGTPKVKRLSTSGFVDVDFHGVKPDQDK